MKSLSPPKYVLDVMEALERRGHEVYMVGGCVRDILLGRRPFDWDVCTSALPDEIMAAFPRSRPTGLKHGTVTVISSGSSVEITTFRSDGEYKDHRHPESVRFTGDLKSDLERRDFTMNALALSLSGEIHDLFAGKKDIENRIIRCVGEPEKRFDEDALRMLRAFRFSAVLGFDIEPKTLGAIKNKAYLAEGLAKERVRSELEKMLLSDSPQFIENVIEFGLLRGIVSSETKKPSLSALKGLSKNRSLRWAGLCALLEKSGVIGSAEAFLALLRLDSASIQSCAKGSSLVSKVAPNDAVSWKRLLSVYGTDAAECAAAAADALYGQGHLRLLRSVIRSGECFSLKQLALSGGELMELGFRGTQIGAALSALLSHVIENPSENNRERLLLLAETMRKP